MVHASIFLRLICLHCPLLLCPLLLVYLSKQCWWKGAGLPNGALIFCTIIVCFTSTFAIVHTGGVIVAPMQVENRIVSSIWSIYIRTIFVSLACHICTYATLAVFPLFTKTLSHFSFHLGTQIVLTIKSQINSWISFLKATWFHTICIPIYLPTSTSLASISFLCLRYIGQTWPSKRPGGSGTVYFRVLQKREKNELGYSSSSQNCGSRTHQRV